MPSIASPPSLPACLAACCLATAAAAEPAHSICPRHPGSPVTQIDLFDGDPAELAFLAPDDDQTAPNTYTVKGIYDDGHHVTIRCHYGTAIIDITLANRVAQCRSSGEPAHPVLSCQ